MDPSYVNYTYIGVAAFVLLLVIFTYNSFVTLRERVFNAMGQIAVTMESRWDAIENLIEATKSYTEHERNTLKEVVKLRSKIGNNSDISEIDKDENLFTNALSKLLAISEQYPELKASKLYESTMNSVNEYEDKVRHSRMIYNDVVTMYNTKIKTFPTSIIATIFRFTQKEYFKNSDRKTNIPTW